MSYISSCENPYLLGVQVHAPLSAVSCRGPEYSEIPFEFFNCLISGTWNTSRAAMASTLTISIWETVTRLQLPWLQQFDLLSLLPDLLFNVHLLTLAKVPAMQQLLSKTFDSWKVHWFIPTSDQHLNSHGVL